MAESNTKERIEWIDVAKGFSMLLIVISHISTLTDVGIAYNVRFYHVPVFMLLSGLFFNSNLSLKETILKYGKRLLKPYYIYGFLIALIYQFNFHQWLLYIQGKRICGSLWFLTLLFCTIMMTRYVVRLSPQWQIIVSILSFLIAYYWVYLVDKTLPLNADVAFFMLPAYLIGYNFKKEILNHKYNLSLCIPIFMVLIILGYYYIDLTPDYFYTNYKCMPLTVIMMLSGMYMTLGFSYHLSSVLEDSKIKQYLKFIGRNSIIFLLTQHSLGMLLFLPSESMFSADYIFRFIWCLAYCTLCTYIINKYLKWTI